MAEEEETQEEVEATQAVEEDQAEEDQPLQILNKSYQQRPTSKLWAHSQLYSMEKENSPTNL